MAEISAPAAGGPAAGGWAAGGFPYGPPPAKLRPQPRLPDPWPAAIGSDEAWPTVSIVLLNYNGGRHNAACLSSLRALDYPRDRFEVLVIDHASVDGSVAEIRRDFPEVRLVEAGINLGFAAGCNFGARSSSADWIAFLNNDTRVDPGWLKALVTAVDQEEGVVCSAAKMLDWEGEEVDFVEGHVVFHGFARQTHWRERVGDSRLDQARSLLFACGGAMLIHRDTFLALGGFDERFWMFFEDVDLGWRLWLAGYQVRFAPDAVTYHRHHGSAEGMGEARRNFLYERNALMMVVKNYEEAHLAPILAASLALVAQRAGDRMQRRALGDDLLDPARWHALRESEVEREVNLGDLASLVALRDLLDQLPEVFEERRRVQALRRRPDAEVLPLLGQARRLYAMGHMRIQPYCEAQQHLWFGLGLDRIFAGNPARVALLCDDGLPSMGLPAGPQGQAAAALLATLEARGDDVIPCLPKRLVADAPELPARVRRFGWDDRNLDERLIRLGPDLIIATHWRCLAFARLTIYRPVVLLWSDEDPLPAFLASLAGSFERASDRTGVRERFLTRDYLRNADLFVFRDEAQRAAALRSMEQWTGWSPPPGRCLVGDGSPTFGPAALAGVADFCRHGFYSSGKLPVDYRPPYPHTPLLLLPLKAWKALRAGGARRLTQDLRLYLRWIWHQVQRRLA